MTKNIAWAWTVVLLSLASASTAWAEVSLPKIFSDGMVLQRQMKVPVWGWGKDGEKVTVEFNGQSKSAVVKDGKWRVDFDPMEAGGPWDMTVKSDNTLTVKDVLVGEVWFTCGQSNMVMGLGQTTGWEEFFNQHQPRSKGRLRVVTATAIPSDTPKEDAPVRWTEPTPSFSAVSYYFAQKLFEHFGEKVPVGIVCVTAVIPAEAWVDAGHIAAHPNLKGLGKDHLGKAHWATSKYYNGGVRPIAPYAIRGVVYYQAEYNAGMVSGRAQEFRYLFPALIASWREAWEQPAMPFLFVQLPGFLYHDAGKDKKLDMDATTLEQLKRTSKYQYVDMRDVQRWVWQNTPRTGMASAIDLGEKYDVHPRNKMPLGGRLLAWARKLAYGEDVVASGPYPKSYEVKDKSFVITYSYAESGLTAKDGKLDGFEIAGADGHYLPAQARIEGQNVIAWSDQVREPAHLRYAWEGFPPCSLYNKEGLPALPFSYGVPGKSFFPDTAQFEFFNPGFKSQKDGKPVGWRVTGNVELVAKGGGGFGVRLEPGAGIFQDQLALGAGYFWNCPPDYTPDLYFLRPGCLVGYSVDMAVEKEGEAVAYMNMASDASGSTSGKIWSWNPAHILKVRNQEFVRYSLTHLIQDQDLGQIGNLKNSVGGRWINQSKTSALLLAEFSSVQIVRPLLEISPATPIQVGAGKASQPIVIRSAQSKTLQERLAPDQQVKESSTILYGCASFVPDDRGLMQKLIEPTDHVGVVLTGKDADKFELVGANTDGKSVKLIGNDKKPGLMGGENPESESFSVRLKDGVPPGKYQAAVRIVTQAVNTGVRSSGKTNEPPLNLFYTDLLIQVQ
jgi:sialate O-acetylesterase